MKKLLALSLLIPSMGFANIINLSCEQFLSEQWKSPIDRIDNTGKKIIKWFIKIDLKEKTLDVNDGKQKHKIVIKDDYYQTSNFKYTLPFEYPIDSTAMRINRKTGIYQVVYHYKSYDDTPTGWLMEFNCSKVENKF